MMRNPRSPSPTFLCAFLLLLEVLAMVTTSSSSRPYCGPVPGSDTDRVQFAMNLEYLEAEFFLYGAMGEGLDKFAPYLTNGGPPPVGGQKANLDELGFHVIQEFAYEEIGHLRAINTTVGGIPRPLLDISKENFAKIFDQAVGYKLVPPFDAYANTINYFLATYLLPYVGLVGYVGTEPFLYNFTTKAVRTRSPYTSIPLLLLVLSLSLSSIFGHLSGCRYSSCIGYTECKRRIPVRLDAQLGTYISILVDLS